MSARLSDALKVARRDYERACIEMDRLTSAPGGPRAAWRWSIPANPGRDSDLIFATALEHVPSLLAKLAAVEALADEWERLWDKAREAGHNTYLPKNTAAIQLRAALTAAESPGRAEGDAGGLA